jgi:23S rRNA (cytosine1962-C5)-methyltransferase
MKRIILKPGEEGRIRSGHPWVYDNEIARVLDGKTAREAALEPGETADVESSRKEYLGRAFVNPASKIRARIYSPSKEGLDKGFFKRRFREAIQRRYGCRFGNSKTVAEESRRLVFGEADFLPGLVIDRFTGWPLARVEAYLKTLAGTPTPGRPLAGELYAEFGAPASWLAVQFLAYGVDCRRDMILAAIAEVLSAPLDPSWDEPLGAPEGIVEKSTASVRELEGLPKREGVISGSIPAGGIVILENGLPFAVNLEEGQKTGHFLDQRENRLRAAAYAGCVNATGTNANCTTATGANANAVTVKGGRVLDACCYSGGFAVHAARFGAEAVVAVDVSAKALELARKNAALNGVEEKLITVEADVFEYLRSCERNREQFDLIILDPPAFAKTKSALEGAIRGYKEINLQAIKLIRNGGVLVTCSCSQAVDEYRFKRMIASAAADSGRRLIQLDFRYQADDHPILLGYDESCYLQCGYYRVID